MAKILVPKGMLDHATSSQAMGTYGHMMPEVRDVAAEPIEVDSS